MVNTYTLPRFCKPKCKPKCKSNGIFGQKKAAYSCYATCCRFMPFLALFLHSNKRSLLHYCKVVYNYRSVAQSAVCKPVFRHSYIVLRQVFKHRFYAAKIVVFPSPNQVYMYYLCHTSLFLSVIKHKNTQNLPYKHYIDGLFSPCWHISSTFLHRFYAVSTPFLRRFQHRRGSTGNTAVSSSLQPLFASCAVLTLHC